MTTKPKTAAVAAGISAVVADTATPTYKAATVVARAATVVTDLLIQIDKRHEI